MQRRDGNPLTQSNNMSHYNAPEDYPVSDMRVRTHIACQMDAPLIDMYLEAGSPLGEIGEVDYNEGTDSDDLGEAKAIKWYAKLSNEKRYEFAAKVKVRSADALLKALYESEIE